MVVVGAAGGVGVGVGAAGGNGAVGNGGVNAWNEGILNDGSCGIWEMPRNEDPAAGQQGGEGPGRCRQTG